MNGDSFSHCTVSIDSCRDGQTHLMPRALREAKEEIDCSLCRDDFSAAKGPEKTPVIPPATACVAAQVTAKQAFNTDDLKLEVNKYRNDPHSIDEGKYGLHRDFKQYNKQVGCVPGYKHGELVS